MYTSVNDSLSVILCVFNILNQYIPKSTMVSVNLSNGPSPPLMACLEIFKVNTKAVSRSLSIIISQLLEYDSST